MEQGWAIAAWAIAACFSQYAGFQGRAIRSGYWFWVLFSVIVALVLVLFGVIVSVVLGAVIGDIVAVVNGLFSLATLLPGLAVGARRHRHLGDAQV